MAVLTRIVVRDLLIPTGRLAEARALVELQKTRHPAAPWVPVMAMIGDAEDDEDAGDAGDDAQRRAGDKTDGASLESRVDGMVEDVPDDDETGAPRVTTWNGVTADPVGSGDNEPVSAGNVHGRAEHGDDFGAAMPPGQRLVIVGRAVLRRVGQWVRQPGARLVLILLALVWLARRRLQRRLAPVGGLVREFAFMAGLEGLWNGRYWFS